MTTHLRVSPTNTFVCYNSSHTSFDSRTESGLLRSDARCLHTGSSRKRQHPAAPGHRRSLRPDHCAVPDPGRPSSVRPGRRLLGNPAHSLQQNETPPGTPGAQPAQAGRGDTRHGSLGQSGSDSDFEPSSPSSSEDEAVDTPEVKKEQAPFNFEHLDISANDLPPVDKEQAAELVECLQEDPMV